MTRRDLGYLRDLVEDEWRRRAIVAKLDEKLRAAGIDPDTDLTPEGNSTPEARARLGARGARRRALMTVAASVASVPELALDTTHLFRRRKAVAVAPEAVR
jgi:hypothetical protein